MKVRKIVDTVAFRGAAENYIDLDMNFVKFMSRHKFSINKEINAAEIAEKYHLYGFVFGNFVTQEERFLFLYKISKQLEALSMIKGSNNLGNQELTIGFGADGRPGSNAHFNARYRMINLNRGRRATYIDLLQGEDSFVHEYGHYLDVTIEQHFGAEPGKKVWASLEIPQQGKDNPLNYIVRPVRKVLHDDDYLKALSGTSKAMYYIQAWEVWARLFEATITHLIKSNEVLKSRYSTFFARNYTAPIYYPKSEIMKSDIKTDVVKALKNVSKFGSDERKKQIITITEKYFAERESRLV